MTRPPSRREWLASCAAGVVMGVRPLRAFGQTAPSALPADWPIFRGDSALRGVSGASLPDSLALVWNFEAESEPTSPVVARGRVIFATRDGDLVSLDLGSGKPVWRAKVEAGFEGAPTCASDLVLIGDLQGAMHAFGFPDGRKVWSHQTPEEAEIKASVAVASGSAIVGAYDGSLHALSLSDGAPRWTHQSDAQIHATCAIGNGLAYVAGCDGHLRGLDAVTGTVKADIRFGGYTASSPAISGDLAVFGTMSNEVVAIDIARNELIWRYTPKKQFPFYSSAAVLDGTAFIGSRDKSLHALDLETGQLQWTFDTQGKVDSSPVLVGSRVFFGSHDGRIRGVDVKTGKGVFSYETGSPVATSPAVAGNRILVASSDGRILCFG